VDFLPELGLELVWREGEGGGSGRKPGGFPRKLYLNKVERKGLEGKREHERGKRGGEFTHQEIVGAY